MSSDLENPNEELLPPEVQAKAEALVKRFFAECFWFWRPDARVENRAQLDLVIRDLRQSGGRSSWMEARELLKCGCWPRVSGVEGI